MPMHCLRCGGQLNPETKEPLCSYCKSEIAREMINKAPIWGLKVVIETLAEIIDNLRLETITLKDEVKKISEALKQKA